MRSLYVDFLRRLLIFSAAAGLIVLGAAFIIPDGYLSPSTPFLFFFFIACTLLSFWVILRSMHKKFIRFVNTFLLTIIAKLVLYLLVMIGYVLLNRDDALPFMISFLVLYLCYTIFETVMVVGASKRPGTGTTGA